MTHCDPAGLGLILGRLTWRKVTPLSIHKSRESAEKPVVSQRRNNMELAVWRYFRLYAGPFIAGCAPEARNFKP
jgi:hypothetical protein